MSALQGIPADQAAAFMKPFLKLPERARPPLFAALRLRDGAPRGSMKTPRQKVFDFLLDIV
ncbi:hypothetical protein [Burkholderia ubonensis]|uniref:hypothetical protein n=1 Tax=Burkholderia ubonensis TaxID=101571 RepID=UPI0012FA4D52|nr:hypothetical protein [Burkholderia ubonensis]